MRIGIGQTLPPGVSFVPANYPGFGPLTAGSITTTEPDITLVDGTVIANPGSTRPTAAQCLPYQCGADSGHSAAIEWCSLGGQAGNLPCNSPQCDPVRSLLNCPTPQAAALPTIATTVAPPQANPQLPTLTPANITQPLPDITAATAPVQVSTAKCSLWCDLNAAIADNPLIALLILGGAAFVMWPKGRG